MEKIGKKTLKKTNKKYEFNVLQVRERMQNKKVNQMETQQQSGITCKMNRVRRDIT